MSLSPLLSHGLALLVGILTGGFILRNNPLKGARTLAELEDLYAKTKARLKRK